MTFDRAVSLFAVIMFAAVAVAGLAIGEPWLVLPLVLALAYWLVRSAITDGVRRAREP